MIKNSTKIQILGKPACTGYCVHVVLLVAMLISFNWKAAHPVLNVTEVELWDKLPKSNPANATN